MRKQFVVIFLLIFFICLNTVAAKVDSQNKKQVVIIKKECKMHYSDNMSGEIRVGTTASMVCEGMVRNIGLADVRNVVISLTPALPKESIAKMRSAIQEILDILKSSLKSSDTEDSERNAKIASTIANLRESDFENLPTASESSIEYLPSKETIPFKVVWIYPHLLDLFGDLNRQRFSPDTLLDHIRMFAMQMVAERNVKFETMKTNISYEPVE